MEISATTLPWKSALPMKPIRMILAVLLITAAPGAWAQALFPQTMNNNPTNGTSSTQTGTNTWGTLPYSSQASFNMMEDASVPQSTVKATTPSYIGVLGEKWETDKRGRRSTFIHNGQEMSVGYDMPRNEPERDTQITRPTLPSALPDSHVFPSTPINPFPPL